MEYSRRQSLLKRILRRRWRLLLALTAVLFTPLIAADRYVESVAADQVYNDLADLPGRRVGLILGTGKWAPSGRVNLFYQRRLEAALALYRKGKVERLLVSGDNSRPDYDEPTEMHDDLVALGVPSEHITLDYAGFRTYDSVIRAKQVFGLDSFVVVSQRFHCLRAVYLARAAGIDAVGFAAQDVGGATGMRIRLREVLARTQAVVDWNILHREPKFLGEPVAIL
jgi:SanA protein